ncbi:hypothetical protein [Streptomyces galbus]|uniref:hypothetical protein n=1 Tax=Streptomyces galbus TaxID=33898 RepID=UPI0019C3A56F|nr:hypothetical protein [Streptomyces galbus]GHD30717.1 hypothetical protein GCM10010335_21060 [Streptomyces galbus]
MLKSKSSLLAAAAASAGCLILAAAPAGAAPYWQSVSTNSTWSCAPTVVHTARAGVGFQACLVRSALDNAQVVLVVVNNSPSAVTVSGTVTADFAAEAGCSSYTLAAGERRGCFGTTAHVPDCLFGAGYPDEQTYGGTVRLTVNGVADTTQSPRTDCVATA